MERFWDARAREDAFYFVDNRQPYRDVDREAFWARGEEELDLLLGALGLTVAGEDVVVEVGCGVGRLTRALAARAQKVWALDVSEEMLDRARRLHRDLRDVLWIHGDGVTLARVPSAVADACVSHVVFQHIPDPEVTLGYVREMGRVLRPGGWAAFQVSNDPAVHQPRPRPRPGGALAVARALVRRRPRGQSNPAWLGSAVDLDDLRSAAQEGGMAVERVVGAGTQFCAVLARRRSD